MTKLYIFTIIIVSFLITGCTTKTELYVTEVDRSGIDMIVMEDEAKVTYLKSTNSIEKFCASRETDSSKTSEQGISLGMSVVGKEDQVGEESGTGAVGLGGRSPAVLITRELMFRACELSMNLNTNKEDSIKIYKMFLDSIGNIVKSEHDTGSGTVVSEPVSNKASSLQFFKEEKKSNEDSDNEEDDEGENDDEDDDDEDSDDE